MRGRLASATQGERSHRGAARVRGQEWGAPAVLNRDGEGRGPAALAGREARESASDLLIPVGRCGRAGRGGKAAGPSHPAAQSSGQAPVGFPLPAGGVHRGPPFPGRLRVWGASGSLSSQ